MPIKAIGRRDVRFASSFHATDKTIASSSFFRAVMADAFALSVNDVMVTGLPRCDRLVKPTARAVALREALVRDYDRFVIWMPTYRFSSLGQSRNDGDCSMDDYVAGFRNSLRDLSRMAVKKHVLVVVKLHPMDFLNDQELDELPGVNLLRSNDRLFASVDPYELLSVSDGLITDVSSVCFDYMVTSKPILITRDALASYRRALVFDLELLFEVVETTESLAMSDRFFDDVLVGERASGGADNCFYDSDLTDASLAVWQAFGLEDEKPRIALAG